MTSDKSELGGENDALGPTWDPQLGTRLGSVIADAGGVTRASVIVGVKPESVAKWRDGKARAPFSALAALSAVTGISLDWIATGVGPKRHDEAKAMGWDAELMRECIKLVVDLLEELDREADGDTMADLVFKLYGLELERKQQGQRLGAAEVVRILKRAG